MKRSYYNRLFLLSLLAVVLFSCSEKPLHQIWTDEQAMLKAMYWQEQNPIYAGGATDWTMGAYYVGVSKAHEATKDPRFLAPIKSFGWYNKWEPYFRTYHADDIIISYSYLYANSTRPNLVNLQPTKEWIDKHLYEQHAWKEGSDPVKSILWWWCDALFMAPPVIAYYAKQTGETEYLDAMHEYFLETYDLLFDHEESLFARDVRFKVTGSESDLLEENGEKIFWSRGNGWVLGGLALMLGDLPKDYENYSFYEDLFVTLASRIKEIQPEDGLWRVSLLNPNGFDHGEVSGTGFFTYALAWGINNGILDEQVYKPAVMKAWNAMRECQHDDGMVGWVQNIGDSPVPANKDSWQNYGTGAFLLAGSEVIKF